MKEALVQEAVVHADETGWRVEASSWWLWVLFSEALTLYYIEPGRCARFVEEMLGTEFRGYLMQGGMRSYDAQLDYAMLRCLLHLKRNAEDPVKRQRGGAKQTPLAFIAFLDEVFALKRESETLDAFAYAKKAEE